MPRYLVLAHQTAANPQLVERVVALRQEAPTAEFVLVVPATPVKLLLRRREGADGRVASQRVAQAQAAFAAAGVPLADARVGDADPRQAVAAEVAGGSQYDAVVVSTLPQEQSRWLRSDLPAQIQAQHALPVIHVQATVADLERMQEMP